MWIKADFFNNLLQTQKEDARTVEKGEREREKEKARDGQTDALRSPNEAQATWSQDDAEEYGQRYEHEWPEGPPESEARDRTPEVIADDRQTRRKQGQDTNSDYEVRERAWFSGLVVLGWSRIRGQIAREDVLVI
jgi:hypothetical protein